MLASQNRCRRFLLCHYEHYEFSIQKVSTNSNLLDIDTDLLILPDAVSCHFYKLCVNFIVNVPLSHWMPDLSVLDNLKWCTSLQWCYCIQISGTFCPASGPLHTAHLKKYHMHYRLISLTDNTSDTISRHTFSEGCSLMTLLKLPPILLSCAIPSPFASSSLSQVSILSIQVSIRSIFSLCSPSFSD